MEERASTAPAPMGFLAVLVTAIILIMVAGVDPHALAAATELTVAYLAWTAVARRGGADR